MPSTDEKRARHVHLVGGTRGLGSVFAQLCREEQGWSHSTVARHPLDQPNSFQCDVTQRDSIGTCLRQVRDVVGELDAIVFFQRWRGSNDPWRGHFDVSVEAVHNYIEASTDHIRPDPRRDKSIVIVSSVSSVFVTQEQDAAYHASRTAQIGLTRYYAHKLGRLGVRVNALSFGNILKETNVEFFAENARLRAALESCTPLGRMGTALEIAKVIRFLVSEDSSWLTGQNMIVDGGASLGWVESRYREQYAT